MTIPQHRVSVVMPIRNEAGFITETLSSLLDQDYPKELIEVLVVEGGSHDGTREILLAARTEFESACFRGYRVLDNPSGQTPVALNIGISNADADVIARVDGHCAIQPDYLSRCVIQLTDLEADNVGGGLRSVGRTHTGRAVALATVSTFGVGGASFRNSDRAGWKDTVYLGTYRRAVFDRVGLFDEELRRNQDDEFNFRLIQSGGRIWYDPALRTTHYARDSFGAHFRQHFEFGLYKVRVMQKRRAVPAWRHLVPAAFVTSLFAALLASFVRRRPGPVLLVAAPYLTVSLVAAAGAARREPELIPGVVVSFGLMHTGYGIGFLVGIWRWRRFFFSGDS